ncbi:neuronal pentraxin-2-like [Ptychodera flava]|uniref:neuronal pentraxin-2-like n=1 Tax=Ptychodera flava TaxID=63121 RepID=UPI00396A9E17
MDRQSVVFAWTKLFVVAVSLITRGVSSSKDPSTLELKSAHTNITVSKYINEMSELTVCVWIKSKKNEGHASLVSYSFDDEDNEVLVHYDGTAFQLWIGGTFQRGDELPLHDGSWHHICTTWSSNDGGWEFFNNGVKHSGGIGLKPDNNVRGGGFMVLGQEQDIQGGRFQETQAVIGSFTEFNMWSRPLNDAEVQGITVDCTAEGDVFTWNIADLRIHGNVSLTYEDICVSPRCALLCRPVIKPIDK